MPDFGIFRGFNDKLFGNKLYAGQLPTQLGTIGSIIITSFLLDAFPNAAAAYSLRKLRTAYTGSAIRVRRSSDNTEQDIGFTALGALDTSSLTTFCGSGNGFVTTWYDQSGNARNATQTTAGNQPQIVSAGNVIVDNSLPVINFNPNAAISNSQNLKTSNFSLSQPYDLFGVMRFTNLIGTFSTPSNLIDGLTVDTLDIREDGSKFEIYAGNFLYANTIGRTTNRSLYNILFNTTSSVYYYNGSTIATGNVGTSNPGGLTIGGYFSGNRTAPSYYNELIIYSSSQSTNRTGISTNINTYYAIY